MCKNLQSTGVRCGLILILLWMMLFSVARAEMSEEDAPFWGVIGKKMSVHRNASESSSTLGTIEKDTVVDVYSKGRTWTKIGFKDRTGYVLTKYVELVQRKNPFDGPMPGTSKHVAVAFVTKDTSFLPEGYRYPIKVTAGSYLSVHTIKEGKIYFPYRREPEDVRLSDSALELIPFVPWDEAKPGDLLYAFTTFYSMSMSKEGNAGRVYNIDLATKRLTHILVGQNEVFSFNAICGPYTEENGYKSAPILSGESTMGFGGGVCQICSTIYNIVLRIPAVIEDMNWHSQGGTSYLPAGFDATVSNTKDMKFRNILPYTLRIEFESLDGVMTAFFYRAEDSSET
ncbi:MAG: VanW family protein [Clostridia bacterium]|nr:VanW family protein [Clostridia bacterium]